MPGRFIYILFIFQILLVRVEKCLAQKAFFQETNRQLAQNIEIGKFQENLNLYAGWKHHSPFQQLTCHQQGLLLHKIGVTYYNLDEENKAIEVFTKTLDRWKDCPGASKSDKANSIYNIGISYQYLNDMYQAGVYLDSAMIMFESDPTYPRDQLAMKYFGVANFYNDGFDSYKAEKNYQLALQYVENEKGYTELTFDILNALLTIKLSSHDYAGAMVVWERAKWVYRKDPSSVDQHALVHFYLNGGNAEWKLYHPETALDHVNRATTLIDKEKDPYSYSIALEIRSMVLASQGRTQEASALLDHIIELRRSRLSTNEDYKALSIAYTNKAELTAKSGNFSMALDFIAKAYQYATFGRQTETSGTQQAGEDLIRDDMQYVQTMDMHAQILEQKFIQQKRLIDLEMALQLSFRIDALLHQKMLSIQHEKSKVDFVQLVVSYYEKGINRALRMHQETGNPRYLENAYYFCAKPKSIVLLSEMNEMEALEISLTNDQKSMKRTLVDRLRTHQKTLSEDTLHQEQHLVAYIQVMREWKKFQTTVERTDPEYYQKKNALIVPLEPRQIRSWVRENTAHLEFFYGDSALYIFCFSKDDMVFEQIGLDPQLVNALHTFISECRDPGLAVNAQNGYYVYSQLVEKCLLKISGQINRIQIVPDGILFKMAFEALPISPYGSMRYMLEAYDVSYAYNAILMQPGPERAYAKTYTGFFTDYTALLNEKLMKRGRLREGERLSELSLSAREIEFGAKSFRGDKYVNREATKTNFISSASQSRILHLSLHGLEDTQNPMNSSILFDDNEDDFVLTASDLFNQYLHPDLVILSACHSGSGRIYGGEGTEGITKAFVLSGANTVVSSLWQAVEGSTVQIITSFFMNMKRGENLDDALAKAKRNYLLQAAPHMQHPYYWAHIVVLGNTDSSHAKKIPMVALMVMGLAVVIIIVCKVIRRCRLSQFRT